MTVKKIPEKRIRIFTCALLAAALCAGLTFTGCAAGKTEPAESSSSGAGANAPASVSAAADATVEKASENTTSAESSAAPAAAVSAATASTGAEYADPDWAADIQESVFSARDKGLLIVIDPGHSSQVPGVMEPVGPGSTEMKDADTVGTYGPSSGLHEYELTMKVSQKLRKELETRGYEVKLTHFDTVNPIGCVDRAAVANENQADAFIRIHANGSEDTEANGAMTVCITKDNPYHPELYSASYRLSTILLDTYCEQTGAKKENVWETDTMTGNNWSEVPTTLIELGYMTNPDEDLEMAQDSYQKTMVNAIADALDKWFAEMPGEELSMHPSLAQESPDEADISSTGDTAAAAVQDDIDETTEADAESGEQTTETDTDSGEQNDDTDADPDGQTPETDADSDEQNDDTQDAVPAGTAAGTGTGVSADTGSTSE